jgi:hypothetical protein
MGLTEMDAKIPISQIQITECRIQMCCEKHCNGSVAKQKEFSAFQKLLPHHCCTGEETMYV